MSQQGKVFKQRHYRNINSLRSVGPGYFQLTSKQNMSQQGKGFRQWYYRNINNL